ncbi:MAG: hypothetical protein COZ06_37960 [Armatimonadetes bacterium CG_4_10_14_3_um_filter_66_18]|nr:hypothetical protein [Armatimonadota bacterium]OIP01968.1 MAG: hypothetical protein AUJ96_16710 [Armatimonadetes bacterium CG2_30_66_41]PIU94480.1 MAG: hypothetical protein COS65_07450 [Armatimonadetes bacterium CG06_land_8_20_14_3_00_66_21]PIX45632.1 MAG: hypothetical protein COZ57_14760 [Armatimonadetes bacterium CG_4_8_14_3_um_filter_66_20]PIY35589.1 MAG: hypothetical protein COZ06_37960 [Armatimonadetes bacterium CG_4_10_14_3_um_filter_66_18]PIZ49658.1 MAG: hypothetical protein COY42_03
MAQQTTDPVEALIDRIAEAVIRKIDERDKIDAIAQAVLARLEEQQTAASPAKAPARTKRPAGKAKQAQARRPRPRQEGQPR